MDTRGELTHIEFTIPARGLNRSAHPADERHSRRSRPAPQTSTDYQPVRGWHPQPDQTASMVLDRGRAGTTAHAPGETCRSAASCFVGGRRGSLTKARSSGEHCRDKRPAGEPLAGKRKLTNVPLGPLPKKTIMLKATLASCRWNWPWSTSRTTSWSRSPRGAIRLRKDVPEGVRPQALCPGKRASQ